MSFAICVYVPEAIVLASDSRQMMQLERRPIVPEHGQEPKEPPQRILTVATDTAEKVFSFYDRVGVAAIGEHVVDGQPLSFEIRNCVYNDCTEKSSVQEVAEALRKHFHDIHPNAKAQFLVAGFEEGAGTPFPEVYSVVTHQNTSKQINFHDGRLIYGCLWMGDGDILSTMLSATEIRDGSGAHHKIALPSLGFEGMTPQDARDFARFAVGVTRTLQRFQLRPKTVGGKTQCLMIFPDGLDWADKWDQVVDAETEQ
ncbi:MAG: hypothetical protein HRF49_03310 [bacterium]|jgi:hypothetical protein